MNNTKPHFDADKAWVILSGRLHGEGLLPQTKDSGRIPTRLRFLKIAAALVIVVATAAMFYFFSTSAETKAILVSNKVSNQTLVKTLADGSVVYLESNSSITFDHRYNSSNRAIKLDGEAFFDVTPNANLPFVVDLTNAKVEVLGTSFNLKNYPGQNIELTVETGKVTFFNNDDPQNSTVVEKGQKLLFDGKSSNKIPSATNTIWQNKHIHFNGEKLSDIISIINKNFEVNITVEDPMVAQKQLTVTFFNNTPNEMISIFCEYYNLDAKFVDETNIVLSKR